MKNLVEFFLKVSKLTTLKRTGWVLLGIKNPETVGQHSFRTACMAFVLGMRTNLQWSRMVRMALVHDICEVYAGDLTPYYGMLPANSQKKKEMLGRWIRLPQQQKRKLAQQRFSVEHKALEKLLSVLQPAVRHEMFSLWLEFEKGTSPEGRFVRQIDKIEALLQAIAYYGTKPYTPVVGWWEEVEEVVEHPLLKQFLKTIQEVLYEKRKGEFERELKFIVSLGKLKKAPRAGWIIRKVRNPESIADHGFMFALMALVMARTIHLPVSSEKIVFLSLISTFPFLRTVEHTPYDSFLKKAKTEQQRKIILQKWVRHSLPERRGLFQKQYKQERQALRKAIQLLEPSLKRKILEEWREFWLKATKESRFLNQMYVLDALLQALQYWKADKKFSIKPWWEWADEHVDQDFSQEFLVELEKRFRVGQ